METRSTKRKTIKLYLMEQGTDKRYIQEIPGRNGLKTTMIYAHACLPAGR